VCHYYAELGELRSHNKTIASCEELDNGRHVYSRKVDGPELQVRVVNPPRTEDELLQGKLSAVDHPCACRRSLSVLRRGCSENKEFANLAGSA
jgi:hypothetical protein